MTFFYLKSDNDKILCICQEFWWWIPQSIHKQCTIYPGPTCCLFGMLQLSSSHLWTAFCHICPSKTVCCFVHIGFTLLPNWLLWANGRGRGCSYCIHHGKDIVKYSDIKGRSNQSSHLWYTCFAGCFFLHWKWSLMLLFNCLLL